MDINDVLKRGVTGDEVHTVDKALQKVGRPTTDEPAKNRVLLYLTDSQVSAIEAHCKATNQKVGTFIKTTFLNAFENKKEDSDAIQEFIKGFDNKKIANAVKKTLLGE